MAVTTRERIVEAGAMLFRRQGWSGTGMKQIATAAVAPFGSIYHFFPGGKDELSAEVIRAAGRAYGQLIPLFFDAEPDLAIATRNAFFGAAETLRSSDFADACPIATVALEVASTNDPLRRATAEVFTAWIDELTARHVRAGLGDAAARALAGTTIALLEGTFILSRATRDAGYVEAAGETMFAAIRAAQAVSTQSR